MTRRAIDPEGWFDTGDLGCLTESGDLCFAGRAKDTIVLSGGENVEPTRVEAALLASPLIEQAIVVGQDRKTLAALLLPQPEAVVRELGGSPDRALLAARPEVRERLRREAISCTERMKPEERVARVALLAEPLDPASGLLTQTLKPRRHRIVERHRDRIEQAYSS
jgi:long-chain acyl-CoA synthetase